MERWEAIVERPIEPGHRPFEKILHTASVVLKSDADLAPFETEWIIDTLLYKPVNLLETVSERRVEDIWSKALADALKLLSDIITAYPYVEKYYENIVNLCVLGYDPELRKHALKCLMMVVKKSDIGAKNASRHVNELEVATQCKTPLALLVGAICEHHPAVICNDITRIWRTYLNMLENSKNTDKVTKSILEGICGLFKHFGEELPIAELNNFYDNLSNIYLKMPSCQSVCFDILHSYASLFRERIILDRPMRDQLWLSISDGSEQAALNVYKVISRHVDKKVLEKIIATEVLPQIQSSYTRIKLTALRILAFTKLKNFGDLTQYVNIQTLENEFRRDKVTHGNADTIEWCIECNLPNSERLLQAAILFYDKLPNTNRKKIVVNGILNSPHDVRQAAIHFLITKSCENVDGFIRIWHDLYDVNNADDIVVKSQLITKEFGSYLGTALEMFLDERKEFEEFPSKLTSLLHLTSKVVPLTSTPLTSCATLLCELAESYSTAELIAALRTVLANANVESDNFYKSLRIEGCRDEATLHESCLALIQASNYIAIEANNLLLALQIIFSSDLEPTILNDALKKFDYLLTHNRKLDQQNVYDTICLVEKLRTRGDNVDKHIRVLHREVLMFLGKHGNVDCNNNTNDSERSIVVNLKKTLSLTLPGYGATYKLNLQKILLLALHHEDPTSLQMIMTMLCANLSSNKEQSTQLALARVIQTLAKIHATGSTPYTDAIHTAIELCDDAECVRDMLQYISLTKSCGVRKLLSTALSSLCEDPDILQLTVERVNVMLSSTELTTKKAGLDLAETIIKGLENKNALSKIILPEILILIANTYEAESKSIFDLAAKMFADKKELFEKEMIQNTIYNLLEKLIKTHTDDVKIYKTTVQMTVDFIKLLPDVNVKERLNVILDCQSHADVKVLYILGIMKREFVFENDVSRNIVGRQNAFLLDSVLKCGFEETELDWFKLEAILKFLEEYCQFILELKYQETIQILSVIVAKLSPKFVKKLRKNIEQCFSAFKRQWKEIPKLIRNGFLTWTETLQLKTITDSLEKEYFPTQHIISVYALKIMSNIFDVQDLILSDVKLDIAKWPKLLLKLYVSGRLEEYWFNEKSYFNDILTVSLKFLTEDDVKKLLKEGSGLNLPTKDIGVLFCGYFIKGFSRVLIEKPFILLADDLRSCSVVLNDLVKFFVRKTCSNEECETLLQLVDDLWPTYEQKTTFAQKHCLLVNLQCLPQKLGVNSKVMRWVVDTVCSSEAKIEEKIKLVSFIPEESFSNPQVTSSLSALFPARFCELRPEMLEAIANKPSSLFVEILAALVDIDRTEGWWDAALEPCLASIAAHDNSTICLTICLDLYNRCVSARVCSRVLAPLLRYSSSDMCQKFLAKTLKKLLTFTKPKVVKGNQNYQKYLEGYMISLHLLLVFFEKLPTSFLEDSSSLIYSGIQSPTPWHIVRETLKLCETLRESKDIACPSDADPELKETYRQFQCVVYNCYCAAVCRRRPGEKFYARLVGTRAWSELVDERKYQLPITPSWFKRNASIPVSVPVEPSYLASHSLTRNSRIFLRTLSENPMLFDLHAQQEDVPEIQEVSLPDTDLNAHPCAATLTALFRHMANLSFNLWPEVAKSLGEGRMNLKLLLAQIICNCKEELKPHASTLLPGLLAAVATTAVDKCLNGLHMDVLDTIIYWKENTSSEHLNSIIHHLITTCVEYHKRNIFNGLVKTLHGLLELYGGSIQIEWKSFEPYYRDQPQATSNAIIKLIKVTCQNKIYIPQLLDKIMSKFNANPSAMAECLGLAMAVCQNVNEREQSLSRFKHILSTCNVTNYIKVLYFASLGYPKCYGEQEFRKIADYVTKVPPSDRTKCLHILAGYLSRSPSSQYITDMFDTIGLSEMIVNDTAALLVVKNGMHLMPDALRRQVVSQIADMCQHSDVKVRKAALEVMLKAFEELFSQSMPPPAKRQKTESTPILNIQGGDVYNNTILVCLGLGAVDNNTDIASAVRQGVGAKLNKDLGIRFAECCIITIYHPSLRNNKAVDLSACVSAVLEMLYSHMRSVENFKNVRLREEPLNVREAPGSSNLLTLSKTFQGTFSSYSLSKSRRKNKTQDKNEPGIDVRIPIDDILESLLEFAKVNKNEPGIDVRIPIDDILESLLEFAKTTPEAARALHTEALHSVLAGTGFDLASALVPPLGTVLTREPTPVTPLCIDVCRVLVGCGGSVESLLAPAERLKNLTAGTEGASLISLLYEEVTMRYHGDRIYQLGYLENSQDVFMDETSTFSIEDLKSTFGKLANWESLTLQQKKSIQNSALPPLWADKKDFVAHLHSYEVPADSRCWFDKMVASYKQEMGPNAMSWLRNIDRWPRRHFEISAITEAVSWRHEPSELMDLHGNIFTISECLSEWSARLMMRSSYYDSLQHSQTDDRINKLSRSHELKWCTRANEMALPNTVLDCVKRNAEDLCKSEMLPWLRQKLIAQKQVGLKRNDVQILQEVLEKAKKYTPELSTDPSMSIEMFHLMLTIHKDMKSLSYNELQTILMQVHETAQQVDWNKSPKAAVSSIFDIAMAYYDDSWDTGALDHGSVLSNMSHVFCQAVDLNTPKVDMLLAILLNRLDEYPCKMEGAIGQKLVEKLAPLAPTLDEFTLNLLKENASKFPANLLKNDSVIIPRDDSMEKYKRCLQIVCDPNHLLTYYCKELLTALKNQDANLWKITFDRMKMKIFENPYTGPSYKLLNKFNEELYQMCNFEATPQFTAQSQTKLQSIIRALYKEPQTTLRLTDLCPTLLEHREQTDVAKLFGLKKERIVKFYDKIQVFTDSIRRPVVLSFLLSNGRVKRAIHKTGERLAGDAAAQRVGACAGRVCGGGGGGYTVTLLDKESALIEYLEKHERLRALIESVHNINVQNNVMRPADDKLIDSKAASLQTYNELCSKIPAYALRSAIEQNSASVQDFISKKQKFTDSLAYMTLLIWLLGLPDRHLQNIMCSQDGGLCCIDWGDICRHGATELPARLTRNLLAVCDLQVLESRLQTTLAAFRESSKLLEAVIKVSFKWMGEEFNKKLTYIEQILRGTTLSYNITREVTSQSDIKHKEKYLDLLDSVFSGVEEKDIYSVEEQVSCLLLHCTSPELLSVTRAGFEPWI